MKVNHEGSKTNDLSDQIEREVDELEPIVAPATLNHNETFVGKSV
jgi:hypothetical protein